MRCMKDTDSLMHRWMSRNAANAAGRASIVKLMKAPGTAMSSMPTPCLPHPMEPLCTVPDHRKKGLAAAALSEMYRRTKTLGATHMTGGGNPFYDKIGYKPAVEWVFWCK